MARETADPLGGPDEWGALAVVATGLPVTAASAFGQVLWLLLVVVIALMVRLSRPNDHDGGNGGGGGGGGRVPTGPSPHQPSGTK